VTRVLGIDPGDERIGVALSDPTGTLASPLTVIKHTSRPVDAAQIAQLAEDHQASIILVGQSMDEEGNPSYQGRKAGRLAEAIRAQCQVPVILWDEDSSTQTARNTRIQMGVSRRKRQGHLDDVAAAVILQSYLDAQAGTQ